MSTDKFDKEIGQLYQQRKRQLVAPEIDINIDVRNKDIKSTSQFSLSRMVAIFIAGGTASFGILAIIGHLANNPVKQENSFNVGHQVEMIKVVTEKVEKDLIPVKQPLTPTPIKKLIKSELGLVVEPNNETALIKDFTFDEGAVQVITLPQLQEPVISMDPTFKVMPKYSVKALMANQTGTIKLSYKIDVNGKVNNIDILETSVNRELQKSAKLALSKWQYKPAQGYKDSYEIIFEFGLDKD